ncbi:LegC family aminotransferase [bacterium]|nr:LegC family aminotransferase [bacterium]
MNDDFIPLSVPFLGGNESRYVQECIETNWVSSVGDFVNRFEDMVARYVGCSHAVATVNGTAALHIALIVAGVGQDDEVIVPTLTFIAPASAIRYVGAWPVFVDVEPVYFQLDLVKLRAFFEKSCHFEGDNLVNNDSNRRIKAIIPVHILGHPVDMVELNKLARYYNLIVIEDATESLGACCGDIKTGNLSSIACFSFNGNKIITTGGGGMIVTNNGSWAERARYLTTQAKDDPLEYIHNEIGYNYRLTNIQAALGCAQMEQLDHFIATKRQIAARYQEHLGQIEGVTVAGEAPDRFSTFWLYTILIDPTITGITSRQALQSLAAHAVQTRPLWHPLYSLPPFSNCQAIDIVQANHIYERALSIPCSVSLKPSEQMLVIEHIQQLIRTGGLCRKST